MLAGRGVKSSTFTAPYIPVTAENLDEWARADWNLKTSGIADGPADAFIMPEAYINSMFNDPEPLK
jgi:hypothetical protein